MKKTIALIMVCLFVLFIAGCGKSVEKRDEGPMGECMKKCMAEGDTTPDMCNKFCTDAVLEGKGDGPRDNEGKEPGPDDRKPPF